MNLEEPSVEDTHVETPPPAVEVEAPKEPSRLVLFLMKALRWAAGIGLLFAFGVVLTWIVRVGPLARELRDVRSDLTAANARIEELEERLSGMEALEQSYASLEVDFKDAETYASTFTEDGIINWARGEIKGRKAIYEFIASGTYNPTRNAEEGKWPAASRHFITNQVIIVEGNTAKAFTYWFQATNNTADRRTMVLGLFGHYEDELVKINGQWYFKKRTIYFPCNWSPSKSRMPDQSLGIIEFPKSPFFFNLFFERN